jgi:hypothetical protein
MTQNRARLIHLIAIVALATLPLTAAAQSATETTRTEPAVTTTATTTADATAATPTTISTPDLEATRQAFDALLDQHPPAVGLILKLDPTLFHNQAYMANYPAISAFIAKHPEVPQNSRYFLQNVYTPSESAPRTPSERIWEDIASGISIFAVFLLVAGVLTWLIRTVIDYRRWSRLSKTQAEVHNKLLDRFTTNDDLLKYVQTPSGQRFLESAPIPLSEAPKTLGAPVNRVLWAVQIGVVLAAAGIGLLFVSFSLEKEVAQAIFALAVLAIFVGLGFVASAVMAYLVSRKLGLWQGEPAAATTVQ